VPGVSGQGVFLSYRHEDAGPYARSLQLQLSQRIPDATIFMDLDSIEAGLDFTEAIEEAVASCAVLVALIGKQWATLTDEDGARRLDNPDDYVRFEVKSALERGVRVIPVLIDGARPLRQQELPDDLRKLARLNAHKLSWDRYQDDANRLLDLIQQVLDAASERAEAELAVLEERARSAAEAGDPVAARDAFAVLVPIRERVSGPEHPDTLRARNDLAWWTGVAGDPEGARDQLAALLPVRERVSGPEDPDTLRARNDLAHWTEKVGGDGEPGAD
jgi:TIR domain/Tetratricopeptide repeat